MSADTFTFEIPGTLPQLNDYIRAERATRFAAARIKREAHAKVIAALAPQCPLPHFHEPVNVTFTWHRPDRRTDKDNVAFAKKFILDALQKAGVIENDKWAMCTPYDGGFFIDRENPRTVVTITKATDLVGF